MIAFINGKVAFRGENFAVVEVAGIGYKVFCSPNVLNKISEGGKVKLLTHLYLREGVMDLYGFLNTEERELFKILLGISGIGPKAALSITSIGSGEQLKRAISAGDQKFFAGVKGLGKKKIQKIILELTGKFKEVRKLEQAAVREDEALKALVALGFSSSIARAVLSQVPGEVKGTQERVKEALKILGR